MNKTETTERPHAAIGFILAVVCLLSAPRGSDGSATVKPLPDLHRPDSMAVFSDRLGITDGERIFIYTLDGFNLRCRFGKRGAGPGEFNPYPQIQTQGKVRLSRAGGEFFVASRAKVSIFTAKGEFIKDRRMADTQAYGLTRFGRGYAGFHVIRFPKWRLEFILLDEHGCKTASLCSVDQPIHLETRQGKGPKMVFIDLLSYGPELKVHGNRVYISGRAGRYIDIYDAGGGRTGSIDCDFPTLKISGNQKNDIWELYRQNKEDIWVRAKEIISVPEYFPRFRTFVIADDKIYVQTYEKKISGTGFYVFNPEGRMLKKIYIPLVYRNSVTPYPYAIHRGELITLVENLDTGDWELRHITKPVNGS